ncbi:MAG: type II secretion system minor pseudopilin GspI [Gammaproteobacteria bacterium]
MKPKADFITRQQRGFTLLEVMVALAVLAIAMAAVIKGIGANVSNMAYLRDRTLAHWVGMDIITESQVRRDWPDPPETDGAMLMGEREWHWQITVEETPDPDVRRMVVETRANKDDRQALTHLISYLVNPQTQIQATP